MGSARSVDVDNPVARLAAASAWPRLALVGLQGVGASVSNGTVRMRTAAPVGTRLRLPPHARPLL